MERGGGTGGGMGEGGVPETSDRGLHEDEVRLGASNHLVAPSHPRVAGCRGGAATGYRGPPVCSAVGWCGVVWCGVLYCSVVCCAVLYTV